MWNFGGEGLAVMVRPAALEARVQIAAERVVMVGSLGWGVGTDREDGCGWNRLFRGS